MGLSIHKPKNKFQEKILKKFPEFIADDFFGVNPDKTDKKIKALGLPLKDCKINEYFKDADWVNNHSMEIRRLYCLKNCGFKCLAFERVF